MDSPPIPDVTYEDGPLTSLIKQDLTQLSNAELDAFLAKIKQLHAGGAALESAMSEEVEMDKAKKTRTPRKAKSPILL